jgi:hypothetical protein
LPLRGIGWALLRLTAFLAPVLLVSPAAFGVGSPRELSGVDYSTAFSLGSLVSLLLGGFALADARPSRGST